MSGRESPVDGDGYDDYEGTGEHAGDDYEHNGSGHPHGAHPGHIGGDGEYYSEDDGYDHQGHGGDGDMYGEHDGEVDERGVYRPRNTEEDYEHDEDGADVEGAEHDDHGYDDYAESGQGHGRQGDHQDGHEDDNDDAGDHHDPSRGGVADNAYTDDSQGRRFSVGGRSAEDAAMGMARRGSKTGASTSTSTSTNEAAAQGRRESFSALQAAFSAAEDGKHGDGLHGDDHHHYGGGDYDDDEAGAGAGAGAGVGGLDHGDMDGLLGAEDDYDDEDEDGHNDGYHNGGFQRGRSGDSGYGANANGGSITKRDLMVARQEREALRAVHRAREAKILLLWALDPSGRRKEGLSQLGDGKDASTNPEQLRLNYGKTLDSLSQIWDKLDQRREAADERVDRLTAILDRHDERLTKLSEAFRRFKRDIAAESKHSRTGKHIARRRILALENDEEKADQDLAEARLKFINLKNQLTRLENQVKQKEELAEGLHLIDFEQLKIENATLHDQIEERHDQLHKLRRKTVTTAQILTHVKEKLQFVKQENKALKESRVAEDANTTALRDDVTRCKHARDSLRTANAKLKQRQGFIDSDLLVSDFESRKGDIVELRARVQGLRARYQELQTYVSAVQSEMAGHAGRPGPTTRGIGITTSTVAGGAAGGGNGGVRLPPIGGTGR